MYSFPNILINGSIKISIQLPLFTHDSSNYDTYSSRELEYSATLMTYLNSGKD